MDRLNFQFAKTTFEFRGDKTFLDELVKHCFIPNAISTLRIWGK